MIYIIFDDECDAYGVFNNVSAMLVHYGHMLYENPGTTGHVLVGTFDEFGVALGFTEPDEYVKGQIDEITKKAKEK